MYSASRIAETPSLADFLQSAGVWPPDKVAEALAELLDNALSASALQALINIVVAIFTLPPEGKEAKSAPGRTALVCMDNGAGMDKDGLDILMTFHRPSTEVSMDSYLLTADPLFLVVE